MLEFIVAQIQKGFKPFFNKFFQPLKKYLTDPFFHVTIKNSPKRSSSDKRTFRRIAFILRPSGGVAV